MAGPRAVADLETIAIDAAARGRACGAGRSRRSWDRSHQVHAAPTRSPRSTSRASAPSAPSSPAHTRRHRPGRGGWRRQRLLRRGLGHRPHRRDREPHLRPACHERLGGRHPGWPGRGRRGRGRPPRRRLQRQLAAAAPVAAAPPIDGLRGPAELARVTRGHRVRLHARGPRRRRLDTCTRCCPPLATSAASARRR